MSRNIGDVPLASKVLRFAQDDNRGDLGCLEGIEGIEGNALRRHYKLDAEEYYDDEFKAD